MTALQIVADAAVKAGLAEVAGASETEGTVDMGGAVRVRLPPAVRAYGLAAINRVYLWIWQQYPYREARLIDVAVPLAAMDAVATMPPELDAVRSVFCVGRSVLPIDAVTEMRQGALWRRLSASSQPSRYVDLPDGVDGDGKAVRRIKMVPPVSEDTTLYVNGLRRFEALAEDGEPLLVRCSNAIYGYLVAELFEYDDQQERAQSERTKAAQELAAAVAWQERIEDTDGQQTPMAEQSFWEG